MAITSLLRDWGVDPSIVRMATSDSLAVVGAPGYLATQQSNIEALNNGAWEWTASDAVLVYASDGWGFYSISADFADLNPLNDVAPLPALADGNFWLGDAANNAVAVVLSGDATMDNAGALTIANDAIDNAKVNAGAAIAFSKLASLADSNILVGSVGNVATAVPMSGDVAIDNAGATTIQAGAVELSMLAAGVAPSHVIKFAAQYTTVGGSATEVIPVAGVVPTDLVFVQSVVQGAGLNVITAAAGTNDITVVFQADPTNNSTINYQVLRAAV